MFIFYRSLKVLFDQVVRAHAIGYPIIIFYRSLKVLFDQVLRAHAIDYPMTFNYQWSAYMMNSKIDKNCTYLSRLFFFLSDINIKNEIVDDFRGGWVLCNTM